MIPLSLRTRGGVSTLHTARAAFATSIDIETATTNTTSTTDKPPVRLPLTGKLVRSADSILSLKPTSPAFATKQKVRMPTRVPMICPPLAQRYAEHDQRHQARLKAEAREAAVAANRARRARKLVNRRSRSPSVPSSTDEHHLSDRSDEDEDITIPARPRSASLAESLHSYIASDDEDENDDEAKAEDEDEDEEMSDGNAEAAGTTTSGAPIPPPIPTPSSSGSSSTSTSPASPPSTPSSRLIHPSTLVTTPDPTSNDLYAVAEQIRDGYTHNQVPFETARDMLRALQDSMPWGPYKKAVAEVCRAVALRNKNVSAPGDGYAMRQFNAAHLRCALWNTYGPGTESVQLARMWAAARE